jgi:hypothetical protein
MLSELSTPFKSTAADVSPLTGLTLWRTGRNFVRFCEQAVADLGLASGELHLALNCDPNTWDRESVQAAKQFHLHLLYWEAPSLMPLGRPQPLGAITDRRLRRQALDPLSFLGARLVTEALEGLHGAIPGAALMTPDDTAVLVGDRPLGAVISLPGWDVIGSEPFEDLVRRIHQRLDRLAARLLVTFTGRHEPPGPWQRHPLLPIGEIRARIAGLPFSDEVKSGLGTLAGVLRGIGPETAHRLARATPARRTRLMTLNQPCYALNLHAAPLQGRSRADVAEVRLIIQPKLFSGIGGAGLLTLGGVPSVRVLRGQGSFSVAQWARRARFQRAFARFNQACLQESASDAAHRLRPSPVRRFAGPDLGWVA